MSKAAAVKIALTPPEAIPLDKLKLHEGNVRRVKNGVSIESLAADIARRGLLQSLSVRPLLTDANEPTGFYGVQAGGRRLAALQLLVKQKKLAKNAPVPCIVRTEGFVEADSLAENTEREALHPLDQFRAFAALREKGEGEETIAAAFGVNVGVVRQRLKLANASPVLLTAYENEDISLDQLMAFCLIDDHARQEQVYEAISAHWNKDPRTIRRLLTETTVHAQDRRALFVGAEAYKAAGGLIIRDLFDDDDGGYLQDIPLLERLTADKLALEADKVRAEGWGWVEAAVDFPWGYQRDFRALTPLQLAHTAEEDEAHEALLAEFESFDGIDPEELDPADAARRDELLRLIGDYESKAAIYDEAQKPTAGALVSLREDGTIQIQRGLVRRADTVKNASGEDATTAFGGEDGGDSALSSGNGPAPAVAEEQEAAGADLSDRLRTELTAYRSLALRHALASDPSMAYLAVLHAFALRLFYRYTSNTCLQIEAKDYLVTPFEGLNAAPAAQFMAADHRKWEETLPEQPEQLWDALLTFDEDRRQALFAHCAGLTINAVHQSHLPGAGKMRHADQLATAVRLDMAAFGWVTRADNYLGRISKAQIMAAVAEAKGEKVAALLADLKKKEMAHEAERLLRGTDWLPEALRTPAPLEEAPAEPLPAFLDEMLAAAE
jgi:ParB family chromosome partitioning protein